MTTLFDTDLSESIADVQLVDVEVPKISRLSSWFGSDATIAPHVGRAVAGCNWCGVVFGGGMSALPYIINAKVRSLVVNDLHEHIINLARVAGHPEYGPKLYRRLRRVPFEPQHLADAQKWCSNHKPRSLDVEAAFHYFICGWMGRSGKAGTDDEFKGGLSARWNANGGDSALRFSGAVWSLRAWRLILARCNFHCMDAFEFIERAAKNDCAANALYLDPPFPGPGDSYKHTFSEADHRKLAKLLRSFRSTRIVCRFYDHQLIRELYREGKAWIWNRIVGRKQTNEEAPEVLIVANGAPRMIEPEQPLSPADGLYTTRP